MNHKEARGADVKNSDTDRSMGGRFSCESPLISMPLGKTSDRLHEGGVYRLTGTKPDAFYSRAVLAVMLAAHLLRESESMSPLYLFLPRRREHSQHLQVHIPAHEEVAELHFVVAKTPALPSLCMTEHRLYDRSALAG